MQSLKATAVLLLCIGTGASAQTLRFEQRPDWLARDGIVMAGSWEPLLFRVRRDGSAGYTPSARQIEDYRREQSPEMIARLKDLGVNFVMLHCYKGAGLEAERASMADAVRFAALCRESGLRVGVYTYSGAFIWELFFKEMPSAKDWVVLDSRGQPVTYDRSAAYRYFWNRNHPAAEDFYRRIVRFAVDEIKTDLVHFDNYNIGPGWDANSVTRFRQYLRDSFSTTDLPALGLTDFETARPPLGNSSNLLRRAWQDFISGSLAESYRRMGEYARSLRSNVLVECNPGGVGDRIMPPVDHGRLLDSGEAYWVESGRVGLTNGRLVSRIRNYKVGRALGNATFDYTLTPLEMAESMAFNLDCLGCVTWFEYGKLVAMPGSTNPVSPDLAPFIRFFHQRRDLLRNATVVADLAVLRSFPSHVFGEATQAALNARLENQLIENRGCFQIIYDTQLRRMHPGSFRLLALAGCAALSEQDIDAVRRHVSAGGKLIVIGPVATHDRWMRLRPASALADLPSNAVIHLDEQDDWLTAIRKAAGGGSLSVQVQPSLGLCAEVTDQSNRRLVHLVNYRRDEPVLNAAVWVRVPENRRPVRLRLASPEHEQDHPLQFTHSGQGVQFQVPNLRTYEIAIVDLE